MCLIDLEPCSVWREEPRKARKDHKCDGCWAVIAVGQKYLSHFSVLDGDATSEAMCSACEAARKEFADVHGTSPTPGFMVELLRECIGERDDKADRWRPMLASILARRANQTAHR